MGTYVPTSVYDLVRLYRDDETNLATGRGVYRRFVELRYLRPYYVIPFLLSLFVLMLYLVGKFMAAGIGRFFWGIFEGGVNRLPWCGAFTRASSRSATSCSTSGSCNSPASWRSSFRGKVSGRSGLSPARIFRRSAAASEPVVTVLCSLFARALERLYHSLPAERVHRPEHDVRPGVPVCDQLRGGDASARGGCRQGGPLRRTIASRQRKMGGMPLRIGTRASPLAQVQARWVALLLQQACVESQPVLIATRGDQHQDSISTAASPGVFTKELQPALLEGRIDLAVHSLKDLPTDEVPGVCLAAVPERASVWDALICRDCASLAELPEGAAVGTGSLRRRAQLLHARPDLQMRDIRGNVDTRLRKLYEGQYDAIVLAEAGLSRLGLAGGISELRRRRSTCLPRAKGPWVWRFVVTTRPRGNPWNRSTTRRPMRPCWPSARCWRRFAGAACAGGGLGRMSGGLPALTGRVLSADGSRKLEASLSAAPSGAVPLGQQVAQELLSQGAAELIEQSRG